MKFAICNKILQDRSFEAQCETAATLGYTGLEIAPFTISPKNNATLLEPSYGEYLLETAQFYGLEIVGLHCLLEKTEQLNTGKGLSLTSPDPTQRTATLEYVKHLSNLCYAMEGQVMVWGSPQQRRVQADWSLDDCAYHAAELLHEVADYCAKQDIILAIEPREHIETNFLTSARETAILLNLIDHPNCKLHLSVKAMSYELDRETPGSPTPQGITPTRELIDQYMADLVYHHRDRIVHFHANEPSLLGPGTSDIDHHPVASALREINYQGWISVEASRYEPTPNEVAQRSIDHLHRVYHSHS